MTQKKILSLFVSLCMVGSCMAAPSIAFADDEISGADANEANGSFVTDLLVIQDTLNAYIQEKGYDARTGIGDGTTVLVQFFEPIEDEDDRAAVRQEFRDYCTEHQLDASLIDVAFLDIAIDDAANLEHAGKLLSQFVAEQKESGNPLFRDSFVQYVGVETPEHEIRKRVLVECYFEDTEAVLAVIRPFMQENGINEDLVVMDCLDVSDLQVIQDALDALIAQNGYDACTMIEDGSDVLVQFNQEPAGEEALDRDAIRTDIMNYCREHHLKTHLVKVEFLDQDTPERQRACELLSQLIDEQKEIGDLIKKHSCVEISNYVYPDREVKTEVIVYCYTADEEAALAVIKDFMQDNEINEDLVHILYETPEPDPTPEAKELEQAIAAFIEEQGFDAYTEILDGTTVDVIFRQQAEYEEAYDEAAIEQQFMDYCKAHQLDESLLFVAFEDAASEPDEEEPAADSQAEPDEEEPAADSQAEPDEEEPAADSQAEPDEEEPAADAQAEPIEKELTPDSQIKPTEKEADLSPANKDDPAIPSAVDMANGEAELPQTGNSDMTKAAAVGLAVLLTAVGTAIVVKNRKETE